MDKYLIGIDLGGMSVKLGLFEPNGERVETWSIPTNKEDEGSHVLPEIAASIRDMLSRRELSLQDIHGVGMGVPGAVTREGMVNRCVNVGWGPIDAQRILKEALGQLEHVRVANDANVAALGEFWQGAGVDARDLCMITLGTGVGGGIILDGRIVDGCFGAAGEIGHILVNPEEVRACNCGKHGCLEQYAAAPGFVRRSIEALEECGCESVLRGRKDLEARDIFDAAKAGDEFALECVDSCSKMIARAMVSVSAVVDPSLFLLGGGMSLAGEILLDHVRKHFQHDAFHASRAADIRLAALGSDAGIVGAAKLTL